MTLLSSLIHHYEGPRKRAETGNERGCNIFIFSVNVNILDSDVTTVGKCGKSTRY